MTTAHHFKLAALVAACALAAGCSSTKLDTDVPVESRTTGASTGSAAGTGANPGATSQSQVASVDLTRNANAAQSNLPRVVYFDFDSYVVKDDSRPVIEANAKALSGDRKRHVTVEGNTDDRGSSEYNLALGQKRAEAVRKQLALVGVPDTQMEAVSLGKEKPRATGHDEAAWAENRRADFLYQ